MPKNKPREEKKPIGERISALLARTIRFVTYDIWRITENEVSGLKEIYINIIKTVILAVRGFQSENLQTKASALTYSTLLSIVPLLAVLLGIAKGFGFQGTVRQELFDYFPGHEMELNKAFEFVESYLAQAQGGVIIGVGLILLFYTVINLISSVCWSRRCGSIRTAPCTRARCRRISSAHWPVRGTGRYPIIWPYSSCCRC